MENEKNEITVWHMLKEVIKPFENIKGYTLIKNVLDGHDYDCNELNYKKDGDYIIVTVNNEKADFILNIYVDLNRNLISYSMDDNYVLKRAIH